MNNHFYKWFGRSMRQGVASNAFMKVALMAITMLVSVGVYAQDKTVTGKVTDSGDKSGLPGVTVSVAGANKGTQTDVNGTYKISVPANASLVFSFVGFEKQTIAVGNKSVIDVSLVSDNKALEEVVVVGYGTVKKKDATGAVTALGSKDFNQGVVTSPEQLMQGRAAGVQITQANGEPGGGINVRIRGTSSVLAGNNPLFVIDGVPLSGDNTSAGNDQQGVGRQPAKNPLNFLNPNDIASIDILKDASATAIYGSRGANGVVLITTKKGKGKGSLEYNVSGAFSSITKKYDLLSAAEYKAAGGQDKGGSTDWQNELFRTAYTQQHDLSYGASDQSGAYRFSLGFMDQQGIILQSGVKRFSVGFNGNKKFINNKLTIGSSINIANTKDQGVPISENVGFEGDLLGSILKANPTRSVYNADGTFNQPGNTEPNPLAFLKLSKDNTNSLRALGNVNAELELMPGLKFKTVLGFDKSLSSRKAAYSKDLVVTSIHNIGRVSITDIETDNNLWENYFTYDKQIGNISFNGLLGYSYQSFEFTDKRVSAANFRTNDLDLMINNLGSAGNALPKDASNLQSVGSVINNSSNNKDELQSYFGRVNVGISNKYLLTATLRVDGSSKFGGNNKYGYFPSAAFKWKLIEEGFVPKDIFSDLALRVGYGLTGNQALPHNVYDRRDRYDAYGINQDANQINGGGLGAVAFNNPNLKWESTSALNFGVDFAILKNRLTGSIDYYKKNTKDLLFKVIAAQPAPNPFVFQNLDTDIENSGLELSLNLVAVDTKDFTWEVLFNVANNRNIVKNLPGLYDTGQINGQGLSLAFAQRLAAGQPLFAYFLREFGGYEGDRTIYTGGDVQKFLDGKSPLPTVTGGLTNNIKYKNFDMSLFFNGVFGNYIYSNTANAYFTAGAFSNGRNVTRNVIGNGEGKFNAPDVSTRFLEKGDFVRLQNLSLGYRVPMGSSKTISGLRLYVTGQNLLTFTSYSGQDPEVSTNKELNGIPSFGIDYSAYPRARTWTVGASITF
jgi:TonB-dependent starch-binding outer membrane protein SusC